MEYESVVTHGRGASTPRWMDEVVGTTVTPARSSTTSSTLRRGNLASEASVALQMKDEWVIDMEHGFGLDFGEAMRHIGRLADVCERVLKEEA